MEEIYGIPLNGEEYSDKGFLFTENLMVPSEFQYDSMVQSSDYRRRVPVFESKEVGFQSSVASESASVIVQNQRRGGGDHNHDEHMMIKAKIASHPFYTKLFGAYIDCQKVGAPAEIAWVLDEIRREKDSYAFETASISLGTDPELDEFMESYYNILVKLKTGLSQPFNEATSFLDNIEAQLSDLCKDDGCASSKDVSGAEDSDAGETSSKSSDRELKQTLLRRYGSDINRLKLVFSKKKKRGKLPKEATQILLQWWNLHNKWPYPTEGDKILLSETTGLDQKQINNWFINQRKRHWKPSENMEFAIENIGKNDNFGY